MRKIILNLAVSLDGMIEGPNGEYDWCIMEPEMAFDQFLEDIDTIFFGRKSYELFGGQNPDSFSSEEERVLFHKMAGKEKYIFSNTLDKAPAKTKLVSGDFEQQVKDIKHKAGKGIWLFGGSSLVTAFVNAGLIDEYQLSLHPIVLGAGKPLFTDIRQRLQLRLVRQQAYPSGVTGLFYEPLRDQEKPATV